MPCHQDRAAERVKKDRGLSERTFGRQRVKNAAFFRMNMPVAFVAKKTTLNSFTIFINGDFQRNVAVGTGTKTLSDRADIVFFHLVATFRKK